MRPGALRSQIVQQVGAERSWHELRQDWVVERFRAAAKLKIAVVIADGRNQKEVRASFFQAREQFLGIRLVGRTVQVFDRINACLQSLPDNHRIIAGRHHTQPRFSSLADESLDLSRSELMKFMDGDPLRAGRARLLYLAPYVLSVLDAPDDLAGKLRRSADEAWSADLQARGRKAVVLRLAPERRAVHQVPEVNASSGYAGSEQLLGRDGKLRPARIISNLLRRASREHQVRVRVNQAWRQRIAACVDQLRAWRPGEGAGFADCRDSSTCEDDFRVLDQ